jgi:phosphotransferase system IIA component
LISIREFDERKLSGTNLFFWLSGLNDENFYEGMICQGTIIENQDNKVKCKIEGTDLIGVILKENDG